MEWRDRVHFYAVAANQMRRILVDYAKSRGREKRGAGADRVDLDDVALVSPELPVSVIDVDEALTRLAAFDPRKCQVIELLYFGGLTVEEAAAELEISPSYGPP